MDLNELYRGHLIAVARAANTVSPGCTEIHRAQVRGYAGRIADVQWLAGVVRSTVVVAA
ncbi:hypothetical protein ACMGDM_18465 [Sphingomonas sp. DT-51]|uniref:hypothetical protein n=1 Tax=Sphingomonas sp. DT-51 TaxID=3396165 RepID=UPI003F1ADCD2